MIKIKDFAFPKEMELALVLLRNYVDVYEKVNRKKIQVRWRRGWFLIGEGTFALLARPKKLIQMTETLSKR